MSKGQDVKIKKITSEPVEKLWGKNYSGGDVKGYESLASALQLAYFRAAKGKGLERHASGEPFNMQDICTELRTFGIAPALVQARKKSKEYLRLDLYAGRNELLDAINYLAAAVIVTTEKMHGK